jgi:N-acetylmuramoyl-L-alanine amidase
MRIVETNIKFNGPLVRRQATKRIVVHHSASGLSTTWQDIHSWHLANKWSGIGYHYVIYPDGTIYRGRPEAMKGAHAYQDAAHDANRDGIGICLVGNFQIGVPTTKQLDSLAWLIKDIQTRYPDIPVIGHKDVMPTACPGQNFSWTGLQDRLDRLEREEEPKVIYKTLNDVPAWGKPLVKKLMDRKSLAGDGKGNINLPESTLKTLVILEREGIIK